MVALEQATSPALKAVVFDWAGTLVDFGSVAPVDAFVEAFSRFGVDVTREEARAPMGLGKRDHIVALARLPRIAESWQAAHGRPFEDEDADRVFIVFEPANALTARRRAGLIPGVLEVAARLRERGISIGTNTGYTREIMGAVALEAARQGFEPDCIVCTDEVPAGRPSPLMLYLALARLGAHPASRVVKVDDTAPGIVEGLAAGCWTVGISATGNGVGLTQAELNSLTGEQRGELVTHATQTLQACGAHYVIDSVAALEPVLDDIERRLAGGERPDFR